VIPRGGAFGRRACALLAACSAVLHGFSLVHPTSVAAAVLILVMLGACLACARDLWARDTLRAWLLVAMMNLTMIAIHAPWPSGGHHHGGGVTAAATAHHSTTMTLATAVAAVEVVAAGAVLYYRTRAIRP
jgi:hypothetical protein